MPNLTRKAISTFEYMPPLFHKIFSITENKNLDFLKLSFDLQRLLDLKRSGVETYSYRYTYKPVFASEHGGGDPV